MTDLAGWIFLLLQIFFLDLVLGADNAVVIALACGRLPPEEMKRAAAFGALGAIALRLCMILFANLLLGVPLVKVVGAWMLVVIALNVQRHEREAAFLTTSAVAAADLMSAAAVIMFADAAMSLDNVVALAAIANGNFWLLALGVLMSIPLLAGGAIILNEIIRRAPEILTIGATFLGWIAGGMAASDPLVAQWIETNAPAIPVVAPPLVALFVLVAGRGVAADEAQPTPLSVRRKNSGSTARRPRPAPETVASASTQAARLEAPSPLPAGPAVALSSASPARPPSSWSEERVVVAGLVLLAFLAGLILFVASFFDRLS